MEGSGMNGIRVAFITLAVLVTPIIAWAQPPGTLPPGLVPPPSSTFNDLACAPSIAFAPPDDRLRIRGSLDTYVKQMMGPPDTLIVNAGLQQGLQVGQQFYVRRLFRGLGALGPDRSHPLSVHTAAWIKLIGVGPTSSTASITHACGDGILVDDYLEPYAPPLVAATQTDGAPQFEHLGHIMMGDLARLTASPGELTTIDRGSDHGIVNGQRFSVYRNNLAAGVLVEIGTAVAVSVSPASTTVQVLTVRDAIMQNDLVAIRR
jgi:hypothetical protein